MHAAPLYLLESLPNLPLMMMKISGLLRLTHLDTMENIHGARNYYLSIFHAPPAQIRKFGNCSVRNVTLTSCMLTHAHIVLFNYRGID